MDLCDSNVWLALALSMHAHHAAAREWFEAVADPRSVLFCRATQQTFLRLLTNASVLSPYGNAPLTNRQAWEAYQALLADDRIAFRSEEPAGLEAQWRRFAVRETGLAQDLDGRLPGRLCARGRVPNGDDGRRLQAVPRAGTRASRGVRTSAA